MKKIISLFRRWFPQRSRGHYYHHQTLTDELERELMKAYMGTGFRGRRF